MPTEMPTGADPDTSAGIQGETSGAPPFWPPPPGWRPGAPTPDLPPPRARSRGWRPVIAVLSTLALLAGALLLVLLVYVMATTNDATGTGGSFAGALCLLFGVPLLVLGAVGWRDLLGPRWKGWPTTRRREPDERAPFWPPPPGWKPTPTHPDEREPAARER